MSAMVVTNTLTGHCEQDTHSSTLAFDTLPLQLIKDLSQTEAALMSPGDASLETKFVNHRCLHMSVRRDRHLYRGTSLIRNTPLLGPYSRIMPRVQRWS